MEENISKVWEEDLLPKHARPSAIDFLPVENATTPLCVIHHAIMVKHAIMETSHVQCEQCDHPNMEAIPYLVVVFFNRVRVSTILGMID